jgi:hypothetical protein
MTFAPTYSSGNGSPNRAVAPYSRKLEHFMLCIFFGKLTVWLERIEERRLSEHLASSTDLIELEHRMRSAERIDYFV